MNRRLVLLASSMMVSAVVTVAADVPTLPHPIGPPVVYTISPNTGATTRPTRVDPPTSGTELIDMARVCLQAMWSMLGGPWW